MNRDPREWLILTLAASGLSEADLYHALKLVEQDGARNTVRHIEQIRRSAIDGRGFRSITDIRRRTSTERRNRDVAREVEGLLTQSAGLTKNEAASILETEFLNLHPDISLPSRNKVALQTWLIRLADVVPPSELLHVSTKIRNQIVHGERTVSDWPIGD